MSSTKAFLKSVPRKDFGKFAKDRDLKVEITVGHCEGQERFPKFVGSVRISGTDVTVHKASQRFLHGGDLNRWSGFDLFVINTVVIQNDRFSVPYRYELQYTLKNDVPKTLRVVSSCRFFVSDLQAMKATGNKGS